MQEDQLSKVEQNNQSDEGSSGNQIMSPITTGIACKQEKCGLISIDLGSIKTITAKHHVKHGPDLGNSSEEESWEDTEENHIEDESSDEKVEDSYMEVGNKEEEYVADSLIEAVAPAPKKPKDPKISTASQPS